MKRIIIFFIVGILTAALASAVFYRSGMLDSVQKSPQSNTHQVSLLENKAEPDIVLVKKGEYVQFNARDGKEHNLAQGSGNATDNSHNHKAAGVGSGVFKKDEAYKVQFNKVGIYAFHDHYNPDTYIRVIVKDK